MPDKNEIKQVGITIEYHDRQIAIFHSDEARYKIIAKGRRFGLTRGMANYTIERAITKPEKILWVDTTYMNIQRYIERYFIPILKDIPKYTWRWHKTKAEIEIDYNGQSLIDFKSAERPENIEGQGYSLVILNEAGIILKNRLLWIESIRPAMMDYEAEAIIGGTPKGKVGKHGEKHLFLELFERGTPPKSSPSDKGRTSLWKSYNFSSYDNPLLNPQEIDEMKSELPQYLIEQEVYGYFIDKAESEIIKAEWWKIIDTNDNGLNEWEKERVIGIYQSWDTAFKKNEENDYSVCTTWVITQSSYYLIDCFRDRLEFPDLKSRAVFQNDLYSPNCILIEDKASGQSLNQELKRKTRLPIKEIKPIGDKVARVNSVTPLFESGRVKVVRKEWTADVIRECSEFPGGEFDDVVDSITQFLNWAKVEIKESTLVTRVIHVRRKSASTSSVKKMRKKRIR